MCVPIGSSVDVRLVSGWWSVEIDAIRFAWDNSCEFLWFDYAIRMSKDNCLVAYEIAITLTRHGLAYWIGSHVARERIFTTFMRYSINRVMRVTCTIAITWSVSCSRHYSALTLKNCDERISLESVTVFCVVVDASLWRLHLPIERIACVRVDHWRSTWPK